MRPTVFSTAILLTLGTFLIPVASANAEHLCTPALARNARMLDRVTHDLEEHIHEEFAHHPWSNHLCRAADALHSAACQLNRSVTNHSPIDFIADDLAQACQAHQQLSRLLRATGVPACVQADMNRAGSLISRLEQQVGPPQYKHGFGGSRIPSQKIPVITPPISRFPGTVIPSQPGPAFPVEPLPYNPGQGNGIHVPAPAVRNNVPSPSLHIGQGWNGRPEVGVQMGNVRLTFTR